MPNTHPLHNLQQQIWDERSGRRRRYLLVSTVRDERWEVALWSNDNSGQGADASEGKCSVWTGEGDHGPEFPTADRHQATRAAEIADAIVAGMLHVDERPKGGFKVFFHVPKPPVVVYVGADDERTHVSDLIDGSFALLSRPKTDNSEVRALTTQLEEKDAEIAALQAKLLSLRGTIARQTATGPKRDGPASPSKKPPPPVALNRLQPNAKRRKLVEEEFAGSEDEDDDDDDDDEDDDDEGDDEEEEDYDE